MMGWYTCSCTTTLILVLNLMKLDVIPIITTVRHWLYIGVDYCWAMAYMDLQQKLHIIEDHEKSDARY